MQGLGDVGGSDALHGDANARQGLFGGAAIGCQGRVGQRHTLFCSEPAGPGMSVVDQQCQPAACIAYWREGKVRGQQCFRPGSVRRKEHVELPAIHNLRVQQAGGAERAGHLLTLCGGGLRNRRERSAKVRGHRHLQRRGVGCAA